MPRSPRVQQRLPSRLDPPIAFAHRGASAHAPENTLEAFRLARRLGATGLESDVWVTADGVAVLDHDGVVKRGRRRTPIGDIDRDDLPDHVPTLAEMVDECADGVHLSLDVKVPRAGDAILDVVRDHGRGLAERTWLCVRDLDLLLDRRDDWNDARLVHSTRLARMSDGPERHAATLAREGVDAVNMRQDDWTGGLAVLFHRFDLYAFGWDHQHEHQLEAGVRMGLDAVYSDHVDTMVDVVTREAG